MKRHSIYCFYAFFLLLGCEQSSQPREPTTTTVQVSPVPSTPTRERVLSADEVVESERAAVETLLKVTPAIDRNEAGHVVAISFWEYEANDDAMEAVGQLPHLRVIRVIRRHGMRLLAFKTAFLLSQSSSLIFRIPHRELSSSVLVATTLCQGCVRPCPTHHWGKENREYGVFRWRYTHPA
jgi:hypothetical protein